MKNRWTHEWTLHLTFYHMEVKLVRSVLSSCLFCETKSRRHNQAPQKLQIQEWFAVFFFNYQGFHQECSLKGILRKKNPLILFGILIILMTFIVHVCNTKTCCVRLTLPKKSFTHIFYVLSLIELRCCNISLLKVRRLMLILSMVLNKLKTPSH